MTTGDRDPGPADDPADRYVDDDEGGDAACWAHLLCTECGTVMDESERDEQDPRCARCRQAAPSAG